MTEAAPVVIIVLDTDHKIMEFNPEAEKLYGLKGIDVIGKDYFELVLPPEARAPAAADFKKVLAGRQTRGFENPITAKDGRVYVLSWSVSRMVDSRRRPIGVVAVGRDVTAQKKADELSQALNEINLTISSTLDLDEIMRRVISKAARAIGCETAVILLREDHFWVARYTYGSPPEPVGTRLTEDEARASVLAAGTRQPVVVNDAYLDARVNPEVMGKYRLRSYMAMPLIAKDEVMGSLLLQNHSEPKPFEPQQVDFVGKLATALSLAIQNAQLYAGQQNIAITLQRSLLKVPAAVPGIDFGYLYQSAADVAEVGGDFYDLFELDHNRAGIVVGDVSGKGLEAATMTSLAKNSIKAYAYEGDSPAEVMSKVSRMIEKNSPPAVFITGFFGVLDIAGGRLTYCGAGHPPAIIKRVSSETFFLETNSPAMGVFPGLEFREDQETLQEHDILVMYTDGITETRADGELYGEARLLDFIRRLDHPPIRRLPDMILEEVTRFTGGGLADDVALLAVELRALR